MKLNRYVLLTIISYFTFTIESKSYNKIRENFKSQLYYCQQSLISSEDKYKSFIEPYIQEAEKTLQIAKYCKKHPESKLTQKYFNCLISFNVQCFNNYIVSRTDDELSYHSKALFGIIKQVNDYGALNIDINEEYQKTSALIHKANIAYYKQLNLVKKLSIALFVRK